jgi:hypothetical protein
VRRRRIAGRTSLAGHRRLPYAAADKLEEEARRGESCTRRLLHHAAANELDEEDVAADKNMEATHDEAGRTSRGRH